MPPGVVLATLLVPQGMAYAELADLSPVTGLYTAVLCLAGYAAFGPSRVLVLGPDSALGSMIAATIVPLAGSGGDPQRAIALASMLAIMVAAMVLLLLAAVAKLGPGAAAEPALPGPGRGRDHRVDRPADIPATARLWRERKTEFLLSVGTLLGVALLGVLPGIAIAVGLSILTVFGRAWWPYQTVLVSLVKESDPQSWAAAWTQVARQVEQRAATALAAGHAVSAREAYLRAYVYNRAALAFISPFDAAARPAWQHAVASGGRQPWPIPWWNRSRCRTAVLISRLLRRTSRRPGKA